MLGDSPSDRDIWEYAETEDLVIVTKDADFSILIAIHTPPPRVVHLRLGNMRLRELRTTMEDLWDQIEASLVSAKLVNVYKDRIESIA